MFTKYLYDVDAFWSVLMHAFTGQCCMRFWNARANSESGKFWRVQLVPKLIVTLATSLGLSQNLYQFHNPHTYFYQCWKCVEDWSSILMRYLVGYANFCPVVQKISISPHYNLREYWTKVHLMFTRCSHIIAAVNACNHVHIFQLVVEWQRKE